jgi:acyl-CoA thioesterase YciA
MSEDQPTGDLALKTVAMPADTNPAGDIFGGWIMSLMDLSAGTAASERAKGRTATVSVSHLSFLRPVKVGDVVCVYTRVIRVGRTSISLAVEAWAVQRGGLDPHKVTSAEFVMVALDGHGKPRPVD